MPWKFDRSLSPGDLDPGGSYTETKITRMLHDSVRGMIVIELEYGAQVNGKWTRGRALPNLPTSITISGDDYLTMLSDHRDLYDGVKTALYQWLANQQRELIPAGDVV